jgi:hypothetical protein
LEPADHNLKVFHPGKIPIRDEDMEGGKAPVSWVGATSIFPITNYLLPEDILVRRLWIQSWEKDGE